jgi:hypothetical protein
MIELALEPKRERVGEELEKFHHEWPAARDPEHVESAQRIH